MVKKSHLQLLLDVLYCTQNYKFYYFLETDCEKKLFNIFWGLCIYFFQKSVNMILENHSIKSDWTACYMLCHLSYIIFPLNSMTWF